MGLLSSLVTIAQNDIDAMRYSQLTFGGTARFASMAGSMGALGGDISTLSYNPAGIGIFRKTELSITPTIVSQANSATYNSTTEINRKLSFNIGNIGLVATIPLSGKENSTGWESINFGFGYNCTNSFQNRIDIKGYNKTSSMLDAFVADANGHSSYDFDQFSTDLAWKTWLINPDTSGTNLYNHVIPHYGELQHKSVDSKGGMGETVLSFGGNYKNKVFIGTTIGFIHERYIEESTYEEIDEKDTISDFKSFKYVQNLSTKGNGYNLKVGIIVKPVDWLRIGAAIHTPSILNLKDNYSSSMKSNLDNNIVYDTVSPKGSFDYSLTTPFRAIGSIGFIISKYGLLNVDYEYIDYTYAQLYSSPNVFGDVNSTIRSRYTSTGNLRVGGEVRLDPISIRAGYALYGSPFNGGENKNANRSSYTGGIGFRENNYFIDFAYVFTKYTEYNYLYDSPTISSVKNDHKSSSFMLTFGVRF